MKDHEIREFVNQLRDIAIEYHGAGQLREKIARVVRAHMLQAGTLANEGTIQAGNSPVIGIDPASGPDHSVEVRYVAPPGYVMVPKEPTDDMCFAPDVRVGNKTWDGYQSSADMAECKAIYEAMLAAVPQEPKS